MADGITHARYAKRAAVVITAGAVMVATVQPVALGLAVGAGGAWLAGPDMDLHVKTEDRQRVWRYSKVLGTLWGWYWWPYDKMNEHRGRSHSIPVGTAERFAWLYWLPLCLSFRHSDDVVWLVLFWLMVFAGQCVVDAVHLRLDGMI